MYYFAGVTDILAIDWGSLQGNKKEEETPTEGSALKRFKPANVLARIGISRSLVGDKVADKVQELIRKEGDNGQCETINVKIKCFSKLNDIK